MINIIIPCYNCKKTIQKTLSSLASQTADKKFIITLIDDCSTEDYSDAVAPFESILNIKKLSIEKNSGAGVARQVGIDYSNCEYLMFLDSDDLLFPHAIEVINWDLQRQKPDIYSGSFYEHRIGNFHIHSHLNKTWLHGKVFKKDFLIKNKISFHPTLRYNEDGVFNTLAFGCTDNIFYSDTPVYLWVNNQFSTVRGGHKDYYIERLYTLPEGRKWVCEELKKRNIIKERNELILDSVVQFYQMGIDIDRVSNGGKYQKEVNKFLNWVRDFSLSIDLKDLLNNKSFLADLGKVYVKNNIVPRYGALVPSITIFEFYLKILEREVSTND